MAWIEPKTDWSAADSIDNRFDATDYNRIKNNIQYLTELAELLKLHFTIEDMGADKSYDSPGFYADEINLFGTNLDIVNKGTFGIDIGEAVTYYANGKFIGYADLNRIESACLRVYDLLLQEKGKEWVLPVTLSQNGRIGGMF
jgi:hypothetical protein